MSPALLSTSSLYVFLLAIDRELAATERSKSCPFCGATLHTANYLRKPRGSPDSVPADFRLRFSNCCSRDGCRRRALVPSVRFLERKLYLGVIVTLVTAMRQGPTPTGSRKLTELFGCSRRTLERWRVWWREAFPVFAFWKAARARFANGIDEKELPGSMVSRFDVESADGIGKLMQFLAPLC